MNDWRAKTLYKFLQLLSRPVKSNFRSGFGDAEFFGDGLMGEVIHFSQNNNSSKTVGKTAQRMLDSVAQQRRIGAELWVAVRMQIDDLVVIVEFVMTMTRASTKLIGGTVSSDPIQPRRKLGVAPEPPQCFERSQIDVLRDITSVFRVTGELQGKRVGVAIGSAHQFIERRVVAFAGEVDQVIL